MATLPDDLQRILDDLEVNLQRAEAVAQGLDDEQLNWRPAPASWSIGQCLDHLNVANRTYLAPMLEAIEKARRQGRSRKGPIRQGFVERWFTETMEPPPRRKLPAPRKIVPSTVRLAKDEVLSEFRRLQGEAVALLRESSGLDLGVRFPNPFIPLVAFTVGTGFLVIASHERRHLWQAERVRGNPGFPGTSSKKRETTP
jgi:hypothetical protein